MGPLLLTLRGPLWMIFLLQSQCSASVYWSHEPRVASGPSQARFSLGLESCAVKGRRHFTEHLGEPGVWPLLFFPIFAGRGRLSMSMKTLRLRKQCTGPPEAKTKT